MRARIEMLRRKNNGKHSKYKTSNIKAISLNESFFGFVE
jgi:hypothetical protein